MNYGIPYQGSKSSIVKDVVKIFPKSTHFYDLFGGGFSITHAMLLHRKNGFKHFHFNEIRQGMTELIQDAIQGKYSYNVYKPVNLNL
jgi:site-specific DNA-adenine methylase